MILWSCYSHLRQWIVPIMYLLMFWAQFRRCFLENNLWWSKNKHLKHPLRQTFLIFHHHCRETIFVEAILTRYHKCLTEKKRPFSTPTIIVHQHVNQRKLEVFTIIKPRRHDKHLQTFQKLLVSNLIFLESGHASGHQKHGYSRYSRATY